MDTNEQPKEIIEQRPNDMVVDRHRETVTFTFDNSHARGQITLMRGEFGVDFDITAPDGTVYVGMIDLFHFTEDGENCLQLCLDLPKGHPSYGNIVHHMRMYPVGTVSNFVE